MAYGDYMHCEVCDGKVFYDARVEYEHNTGDHKALCKDCSEHHELVCQLKAHKGKEGGWRPTTD